VADSVNPIPLTRDAWHSVAKQSAVPTVDIELICSDRLEHQRRVESRVADIKGHKLPTWQEVLDREYSTSWGRNHHAIDTAGRTVQECTDLIRELLAAPPPTS
jgi:hypothetical protein